MPPQISFSNIPPNLRIPLFWAEFDNSQAGVNVVNQRALLIGQTITAQPVKPVYVPSAAVASSLFGANSHLALMVAAYRAADPFGELWCLPIADAASSVAAAGSVVFSGTPTVGGTVSLYVNGRSYQLGVTAAETATQIATAMAALINADPGAPVTAAPSTGTVALTADNKGTVGNSIDIQLNYRGIPGGEQTPAGLTVAVTAMASGATDPALAALSPTLDQVLGDVEYDFIGLGGWSGSTQLAAITALMNNSAGRWSWLRQVYGHVWTAKKGADATGSDLLTFGATMNDPHMTVIGYEPSPSSPFEVAATWVGAAAVALKADAARPLQTLALPGILAPVSGGRFIKSTQQSLLTTGIALMQYAPDSSAAILRSVTTYQLNAFGQADQSYLDCEILFTNMAVIRALKSATTQKFPRAKLAADGTSFGPGSNIVTPKAFKSELIAQYRGLIDLGLVQDIDDFAAGMVVQINANDPSRLDVLFDPYLVSGLRIIAVLDQFRLKVPVAA